MSSIGVVVLHHDPLVVEQIAEALEAVSDIFVAGTSIAAGVRPAVVVAGGDALEGVERHVAPMVALAGAEPIRAARAAIASSAVDIVAWPAESHRLAAAVRRAASARRPVGAVGRTVSVRGARGGLGATTLCALMAEACGGFVLDLLGHHRMFGDEHDGVDLPDEPTPDAVAAAARLTPLGASILSLRMTPRPPAARGLLAAAKQAAAAVVVDGGHVDLGETDASIVLVGRDVASVRAARHLIDEQTVVVLRRTRSGLSKREVTAALGRPIDAVIPEEASVARAVDLGRIPSAGRTVRVARDLATRVGLLT